MLQWILRILYSTAALGKRLVDKFDEEFDNNKQRQVDLIKGIIYGIENVIEQMKLIIKSENETTEFWIFPFW